MPDVLTFDELREAYEERARRLTETVESRERWLSVLSAVAVRTHGCEDTREILEIAISEILARFGLKAAWVFMGSLDDKKLHFAASQGVSKEYLEAVGQRLAQALSFVVVEATALLNLPMQAS